MADIVDFTDQEQALVQATLDERYSKGEVNMQLVDVDARLDPSDRDTTECPALYWEDGDCHFVLMKTGERKYRTQFYYQSREQFNTGIHEYDDLADCVVTLLRLQADHHLTETLDKEDGE